jgi:cobalt/nickel transport system permease protein
LDLLEHYRNKQSIIHSIHARVKILFTLVFILAINFTPTGAWPGYILFFSVLLSIVLISRVGLTYILKRSLFALPFMLSAIPLIFWGPPPFISFHIFDPVIIPISVTGLERSISITIKAWLSVQAAILLTATTPFSQLISGFRQLHVPAIIISIIELMWRYLFVMVNEVNRLTIARNSRSSKLDDRHHSGGSIFWRAKVTGSMAGSLFLRSIERSERVYAAMLSRGYNGEPLPEQNVEFTHSDRIILVLSFALIFLIYIFGILTGRQ